MTDLVCSLFRDGSISPPSLRRLRCGDARPDSLSAIAAARVFLRDADSHTTGAPCSPRERKATTIRWSSVLAGHQNRGSPSAPALTAGRVTAAAYGFSTERTTRCRGAGRRVCSFPSPCGADAPRKIGAACGPLWGQGQDAVFRLLVPFDYRTR